MANTTTQFNMPRAQNYGAWSGGRVNLPGPDFSSAAQQTYSNQGGGGGGRGGGGPIGTEGYSGGTGNFVTPMSQWTTGNANKYDWQGGDPARAAMLNQIDWSGAGAGTHAEKAAMIEEFMRTGIMPGGGGGGGGAGGGGGSSIEQNLGYMAGAGKGLMDPASDYFGQLASGMQQQIGGAGAAAERSAALRGAYGGMGGGQGQELMATQADINQSTLGAQGQAMANLRLEAPKLGAEMLGKTFGTHLGLEQLGEGSRQFGAGQAESARQFGANVGLQQEQMAAQRAMQEQQFAMQQQQWEQEQQMMKDQMAGSWAMSQGAPPPWYGGGGGGGAGSTGSAFGIYG